MPDLFPQERCPHCRKLLHEPPLASLADPVLLTYETVGSVKEWFLSRSQLAQLQEAFPTLDVLDQCRKALVWIGCNPTKRKTAKGMPKFLFSWLAKANDSGANGRAPARRTYHDDRPVVPGMTKQQIADQREQLRTAEAALAPEAKELVAKLRQTLAQNLKPPQ